MPSLRLEAHRKRPRHAPATHNPSHPSQAPQAPETGEAPKVLYGAVMRRRLGGGYLGRDTSRHA